ncbi:MAG: hypothetical protein ACKO17_00475, partial [Bacteroidota bacterium]
MTSNVPLIPPAEGLSYALNDPTLAGFERLRRIMDQLRENCPWDKKQTFESLRSLTIEEVYELSDAI